MGKIALWIKIVGIVRLLAAELSAAAADKKITIAEAFKILGVVCKEFGIDLDTSGFDTETKKIVK